MARQTLETRVESLERRVTTLEQLPERMDPLESQILQLRQEMRDEFSAVRVEMATGEEETRRTLGEEVRAGDEETRRVLRAEIREGQVMIITELTEQIEDSRRYTRVLFEDAIGRIALVSEGLAALSGRVDGVETRLSIQIERTDAKLDMVLARLDRLARDQH